MCFRRLFSRRTGVDARLAQLRAEADASQVKRVKEAMAVPEDARPLAEQIRDFIWRAQRPKSSGLRCSYPDNKADSGALDGLQKGTSGSAAERLIKDRPKSNIRHSYPDAEPASGALCGLPQETVDSDVEQIFKNIPESAVKYSLREETPSSEEQYSLPGGWHQDYSSWANARGKKQTFREFILHQLEVRRLEPSDFYSAAGLDRKLFSRMKNEPRYQPSKDTAIRCCLALKLDDGQTEHALGLAGYTLSWSLHEDLAVRWCIQHRIFRVYDVMEVLDELK